MNYDWTDAAKNLALGTHATFTEAETLLKPLQGGMDPRDGFRVARAVIDDMTTGLDVAAIGEALERAVRDGSIW